jgi:hypothetical protein
MKTIKESIIGRKGVMSFGRLVSGQIVIMKNGYHFMYLNYEDADSLPEVSDKIKNAERYGYDFTFGGFFYEKEEHDVDFMTSGSYTFDLKYKNPDHGWDVEYVSEHVFKIGLYKEQQLKEMSRKIKFRKIK